MEFNRSQYVPNVLREFFTPLTGINLIIDIFDTDKIKISISREGIILDKEESDALSKACFKAVVKGFESFIDDINKNENLKEKIENLYECLTGKSVNNVIFYLYLSSVPRKKIFLEFKKLIEKYYRFNVLKFENGKLKEDVMQFDKLKSSSKDVMLLFTKGLTPYIKTKSLIKDYRGDFEYMLDLLSKALKKMENKLIVYKEAECHLLNLLLDNINRVDLKDLVYKNVIEDKKRYKSKLEKLYNIVFGKSNVIDGLSVEFMSNLYHSRKTLAKDLQRKDYS